MKQSESIALHCCNGAGARHDAHPGSRSRRQKTLQGAQIHSAVPAPGTVPHGRQSAVQRKIRAGAVIGARAAVAADQLALLATLEAVVVVFVVLQE